jgi:hypothetical protein
MDEQQDGGNGDRDRANNSSVSPFSNHVAFYPSFVILFAIVLASQQMHNRSFPLFPR